MRPIGTLTWRKSRAFERFILVSQSTVLNLQVYKILREGKFSEAVSNHESLEYTTTEDLSRLYNCRVLEFQRSPLTPENLPLCSTVLSLIEFSCSPKVYICPLVEATANNPCSGLKLATSTPLHKLRGTSGDLILRYNFLKTFELLLIFGYKFSLCDAFLLYLQESKKHFGIFLSRNFES